MDPQLGMFIQPDWWEVTEPGVGTNRYAYAGGDPVNLSDANGHIVPLVVGIIAGAAWLMSGDPANAPGPGDKTLEPHGLENMAITATASAGVAVLGTRALISCAANATCRSVIVGAEAAETAADLEGCAEGDMISCAATALPGVNGKLGKVIGSAEAATKPVVVDQRLGRIVDSIYSGTTNPMRFGDGSLMDAARHELSGGERIFGKNHVQEARDTLKALQKWRQNPPGGTLQSDLSVADELIWQLRRTLGYE